MEDDDFIRRFEIYQISKNRSLVIDLFKDANEKQRQKILNHEEKKLNKTKVTKDSDTLPSASEQEQLLNELKRIR